MLNNVCKMCKRIDRHRCWLVEQQRIYLYCYGCISKHDVVDDIYCVIMYDNLYKYNRNPTIRGFYA